MTQSELLFSAATGIVSVLILFLTTQIQVRKSRAAVDSRMTAVQTDAQEMINAHYQALTAKADEAEHRANETALHLSDTQHALELVRLSNEASAHRITRMESELSTARSAGDIAFEALKTANSQITELLHRVRELETERNSYQTTIKELSANVATLTTDNRQIAELTRRVKELETDLAVSQREIGNLKTQLAAERAANQRAAEELENERHRANDQESRLREQAIQIQQMSVKITALEAEKAKRDESTIIPLGAVPALALVPPVDGGASGDDTPA